MPFLCHVVPITVPCPSQFYVVPVPCLTKFVSCCAMPCPTKPTIVPCPCRAWLSSCRAVPCSTKSTIVPCPCRASLFSCPVPMTVPAQTVSCRAVPNLYRAQIVLVPSFFVPCPCRAVPARPAWHLYMGGFRDHSHNEHKVKEDDKDGNECQLFSPKSKIEKQEEKKKSKGSPRVYYFNL